MLNESLLQNFPPTDEKEVFDIIQFIKKSPLAKDYWRILKTLYKKTEKYFLSLKGQESHLIDSQATSNQLLMITHLIYKLDQTDTESIKSPYPTHATLRYMKRRARRFLRTLAKEQPQYYFEIASKLITFQTDKPSLNFTYQWVMADILLGNSRRCEQRGHGQGKYIFKSNRYHLHEREDGQPQIWDTQLNFVQELLMKNLPWEIYEFAIKILHQHQATPTQLSEEVLERFFNTPSHWLKRTATSLTYQTFLFQGVKPALFAGMWLYSNATLRKKIDEIDANRPDKGTQWYKDFGKLLFKYSFNELRIGNNSKRIVEALELVQQKYAQEIQPDSILPIAPALFQSKHKALNDLALWGANAAQQSEALEWLVALGNEAEEALYNRLAVKLMKLFKKRDMYPHEIESYIYHPNFYVGDFGWKLSVKVNDWSMYSIWYNVTNYQSKSRMKKTYFINAISSVAGATAFVKYYKSNSYSLNYLPTYAYTDILNHGLQKVQDFVLGCLKSNFRSNPMDNLDTISGLPSDIRELVLEAGLQHVKNKKLFQQYWDVSSGLQAADTNDWAQAAFMKILDVAKITNKAAGHIIQCVFDFKEQLIQAVMQYIVNLDNSKKRKELFITHLGQKLSNDVNIGVHLPVDLMAEIMQKMNFAMLLKLTATADENAWKNLSKSVYQQLLGKQNETGFWKNILERVLESENEILSNRLIEDQAFFQLFQQQKDTSVIEITHPSFEQVLLGWVKNNEDVFTMGSGALSTLCFHKLPSLRQWGLAKATSLGINIMFGLQMLESGIPDTMQTSQNYFNSLATGSADETEAALALCDSPSKEVRAFGMQFLAERKDKLKDHPQVLAFLSEHADAFVQAFVSQEISTQQLNQPFVERFDKEVLRMKNRSRKAKEHTKKRVEATLQMDTGVLKEVARSGGRTDAEWAILQLTKKALAGEEIEGFTLD